MSEKHYRWKDIQKPTQRLNAFLTPNKELPAKFAPSRDRSLSVDKLFNLSRSRLHSSTDIIPLNQTHEDSFRGREDSRRKEVEEKIEEAKKETDDKKASITRFPTLSLVMQQSSLTAENRQSVVAINQLKKEFWAFKQNVLRELERQKEFVLKFVKEIVLTLQLEIEKLSVHQPELSHGPKSVISTAEIPQIKTLQSWKASLTNVNLTSPASAAMGKMAEVSQLKSVTSPGRFETAKDTPFSPPSPLLDVGAFLKNIQALRRDLNQMDKVLEGNHSKAGKA